MLVFVRAMKPVLTQCLPAEARLDLQLSFGEVELLLFADSRAFGSWILGALSGCLVFVSPNSIGMTINQS